MDDFLKPLHFAQIVTALFIAALFLQSGLDKIFCFKDNLSWLTGHFSKSPLRSQVKGMLVVVTIGELLAGGLSGIGAVQLIIGHSSPLALHGAQAGALVILMLFIGQRIAKEYAGAGVLVPYFILCIGGVILQGM